MIDNKENSNLIEKIKNDENFNCKSPYSYYKLLHSLQEVNKDLDRIKPYEFLQSYFELTKSFSALGPGISYGFSDITTKITIWRNLFVIYYPSASTIQQVIEKEIEKNLSDLNGDNNSSLGYKKGNFYYNYTSGSRTLLRMTWFLKFMSTAFKDMILTEDNFAQCLKKSYENNLAPHHPWLVRKGALLAMSFAPADKKIPMKALVGDENLSEENKEKLMKIVENMEQLYNYNMKYLEDKNLLNTP